MNFSTHMEQIFNVPIANTCVKAPIINNLNEHLPIVLSNIIYSYITNTISDYDKCVEQIKQMNMQMMLSVILLHIGYIYIKGTHYKRV